MCVSVLVCKSAFMFLVLICLRLFACVWCVWRVCVCVLLLVDAVGVVRCGL